MEIFLKKLMKIIVNETSISLIVMNYKIKKEIKINYKIIIAISNIIKSIIYTFIFKSRLWTG